MRYTLRLLTIQQFERAALLICVLRDDLVAATTDLGDGADLDRPLGGPGRRAEHVSGSRDALDRSANEQDVIEGEPRSAACVSVVRRTSLTAMAVRDRDATAASCGSGAATSTAPFSGRLPVFVVDEDIYDGRPTLMIATADKFAALPWRPETRVGSSTWLGLADRPNSSSRTSST